jgi:hypothetical protein
MEKRKRSDDCIIDNRIKNINNNLKFYYHGHSSTGTGAKRALQQQQEILAEREKESESREQLFVKLEAFDKKLDTLKSVLLMSYQRY